MPELSPQDEVLRAEEQEGQQVGPPAPTIDAGTNPYARAQREADPGPIVNHLTDEGKDRKKNKGVIRRLVRAGSRGVSKAIDETSNLVVGLGAEINKRTGLYKVLNEEGEENFLRWYQMQDRANPMTTEKFRNRYLGESTSAWEGVVESGTQFLAGFIGVGRVLKVAKTGIGLGLTARGTRSIEQLVKGTDTFVDVLKAGKGGKAAAANLLREMAYESVRGAGADVAVFAGQEERLSDMLIQVPALSNPVTRYLAGDESDSEFEGRMKNLLEGAMLGAGIDAFISGVRFLRRGRTLAKAIEADNAKLAKSLSEEMVEDFEKVLAWDSSQITDLDEIPDTLARAGVRVADDGGVEVVVKLTDEEKEIIGRKLVDPDDPSLAAAGLDADDLPLDSNDLIGLEGAGDMRPSVVDQDTGKVFQGHSHEDAYEKIAASKLPGGSPEEITALKDELMNAYPKEADGYIKGGDPESFMSREAATRELRRRSEEGIVTMRFDDVEEAHQTAAALELMHAARLQQKGISEKEPLTKELLDLFIEEAGRVEAAWKAGDADAIKAAIADSDINLKFIHNNIEAKASIVAVSRIHQGTKLSLTEKQMKKLTRGLYPPDMTHDEAMAQFAKVFGHGQDMSSHVIAMRSYLAAVGRHAAQLAKLAEMSKGLAKEVSTARLADVMDQMLDLQNLVAGVGSNAGRTLRAFGINVGPSKLRSGLAGVQQARDAVERAAEKVKRAVAEGRDASVVERQHDEAVDRLEKLLAEETDLRIEEGRRAEGVAAEQLPDTPRNLDAEVPPTPQPKPEMTRAEKAELLRKKADEFIEAEAKREGQIAELEKLASLEAPGGRQSVRGRSPEEIDALVRMVYMSKEGDPAEILQQILVPAASRVARDGVAFHQAPELTGFRKGLRAVQWYRVNAMLSGPRTHAINSLSNAMTALSRPLELAFGGGLRGNRESVREAGDMIASMFQHWGDAWTASRKAMSLGQGILDPKSTHFSQSFSATQGAMRGGDAGLFSRIVSTPGTWLMGLDEFASQLSYHAHLRAGLMKAGRRAGKEGEELADWVTRHLQFGYSPDGRGVIPDAVQFARENTFKAELGDAGQAFEKLVNGNHVVGDFLSVLMPFRKTPINITKYAWQRFPGINLLSANYRRALSGRAGQRAAEEALGKLVIGSMMYSSAGALFFSGKLTGDGPRDPRLRKAWLEAGNRPGTLTIGNVSIELRRLDPVMTPFVMTANLMEAAGELDEESYREAAALLTLTMAESVAERSFFTGLTEFFEATMQGSPDLLDKWSNNTMSSMVPNILKQANIERTWRESEGALEEILGKVPGYSQTLEPRRNIFGEPALKPPGYRWQQPFNPFTMTFGQTVDQKLASELYDAGASMAMPPEVKSFGEGGSINLRERDKYVSVREGAPKRQSPYDRWIELTASEGINGGRTLKQRFRRMAETQAWQEGDDPTRRTMAENIISSARDAAWAQLMTEFPDLHNEVMFRQTMGQVKSDTADEDVLQGIRNEFGLDERGRWADLSRFLTQNQ